MPKTAVEPLMSSTTTRPLGLLMALLLALSALPLAMPVAAASSPEAAVNELMDAVASGNLDAIDDLVCAEQRDQVREQFEKGAMLGVSAESGADLDALTIQLSDRSVELVSDDGDSTTVRMSATMTIDVEEDQARDLVRAMLEAEGEPVIDEELDLVVPMMMAAFTQGQAIDEELTLILDDGQWVICGGLGVEEDPALSEASVSFDGLCGLVALADINAASLPELQYDSSVGFEEVCNYSTSSFEDYHALTLSFGAGERLDGYKSFYPDGTDLTVAGAPTWATDDQLFIEAPEGLLQVSAYPGEDPPADYDAVTHLAPIAELVVPLLSTIAPAEPVAVEPVEAEPETSLCAALTPEQLDGLSDVPFDHSEGSADYCAYTSTLDESAFHVVSTSVAELALDDFKSYFPDGQELTVAGQPAFADAGQIWVGLADGRTFGVAAFVAVSAQGEGIDDTEFGIQIAELAVPNVPEYSGPPIEPISISGDAATDADSLCVHLDLDAVNAIGGLQFDDAWDGGDICVLSQTDPDSGFESLSIWRETSEFDELSSFMVGGEETTAAGVPAYTDDEILWIDTSDGAIAISAIHESETGGEEFDAVDYATQVAELVVASIEAAS